MIQERFGEDQWLAVLQESGVPQDSFLTMRSYDDSITYSLVGAASKVLDAPPEACLEMFGKYWVIDVTSKHYSALMNASGQTLVTFLRNMNTLHDRITGTFLNYVPPEFRVEDLDENVYLIHYESTRQGLTSFVIGLLKGLAERFGTTIEISSVTEEALETGAHTIFKIKIIDAKA